MLSPSIVDVARAAGTSPATVSRVITGSVAVSPNLRARCLRAISKLNYQPNRAAQNLRRTTRKLNKGLIYGALVVASLKVEHDENTFMRNQGAIYEGMLHAAHDADLNLILRLVPQEQWDLPFAPPVFSGLAYDGVLASPHASFEGEAFRHVGPTMWFGSRPQALPGASVVEPDSHRGVQAVARRLFDLGHRRIAFVCENMRNPQYQDRLNAFRAFVESRHLEACDPSEFVVGDDATAFLDAYRKSRRRPTAVMAASDGVGCALVEAFQSAGIGVPDRVSVTGFDGRDKSRWCNPSLTTWEVDWDALGRTAVHQLVALIEGRIAETRTLIGGKILDQGSVSEDPG